MSVCGFLSCFLFLVLGIKVTTLHLPGRSYAIKLYSQPWYVFSSKNLYTFLSKDLYDLQELFKKNHPLFIQVLALFSIAQKFKSILMLLDFIDTSCAFLSVDKIFQKTSEFPIF